MTCISSDSTSTVRLTPLRVSSNEYDELIINTVLSMSTDIIQ